MKSKVIVITGASSGIGMETAKLLASAGHKLILAARREEKLKALVTSIKNKNGEANYLVTDVTKHHEVEKLAQFAISKSIKTLKTEMKQLMSILKEHFMV